jgi:hypothetical protein
MSEPMTAGRELDALIAERVMGHVLKSPVYATPDYVLEWDGPPGNGTSRARELPHYSTEITAAWEVVEKLDAQKHFLEIERRGDRREDGDYFMRWACGLWPSYVEAEAETVPLAICRAALKAVAVRALPTEQEPR